MLQGVDIGPLLGKGSYGRVYKGRWKGAMVAIKVLDHALILQDDISRETLLSTSIAHPCVVSAAGRGAAESKALCGRKVHKTPSTSLYLLTRSVEDRQDCS